MDSIRYGICAFDPGTRIYRITVDLPRSDPAGQRFRLPAWIPGSYLVRDFARHIVRLRALADGRPWKVGKVDKHTWQCAPRADGGPITLAYEVHAGDLSVREAHLDSTRGFFNGSAVFLLPEGWSDAPCLVDIFPPQAGGHGWRLATGLAPVAGTRRGQFGRYRATDYDELIDCPVEMGDFLSGRFRAGGVEHEVVITGAPPATDLARLCSDLAQVCEQHVRMFEPRRRAAPFDRYTFLLLATPDGYGGLEHRNSTALVAHRDDLPYPGMGAPGEGYRRLLGLASHEYFHAWNVKRIRPAAFVPYDLQRENYTSLLWFFEGFTSYYDDLALVRSGRITREQYRELVEANLNAVQQRSGRRKQSLAQSSFDAWIKYYRPDENSPNAVVSYYQKGALVALALDLHLRRASAGRRGLDHVMRRLWSEFRAAGPAYRGIAEDAIAPAVLAATGIDVGALLERWVAGTQDPDLAGPLPSFGWQLETTALEGPAHRARLGLRLAGKTARVASVDDEGPAPGAGIAPGDEIVAIEGARADTAARVDALLGRIAAGSTVEVLVFRRDALLRLPVRLARQAPTTWKLRELAAPGAAALRLRRGWIGS